MADQIFCPNCGKAANVGAKFCAGCGTPFPQQAAPQAAPQQPAPQQAPQAAPVQQQAAPQQQAPVNDPYAAAKMTQKSNPNVNSVPNATPAQAAAAPAAGGASGSNWVADHKAIIGIGCAALIVIIAAIVILINLLGYTKIDAKDLIKVDFQGLEGSGTATAELNAYPSYMYLGDDMKSALGSIDYDDIDEDDLESLQGLLGGDSKKSKETVSKYLSLDNSTLKKAFDTDKLSEAKSMRKALLKESDGKYKITATVSKNKNLKNGDKVTVKVKYPESYLKSKKIKLTNTEFEVTVKGLQKGTKLDPFKDINVSFSGFNGKGTASVDCSSELYGNLYGLDYSYTSELSNGDSYPVTVRFYYEVKKSGKQSYIEYNKKYYIIDNEAAGTDQLTKDYKVEGLKELEEIDPFEGIQFEYSGALPFVRATYVKTESVNPSIADNVYFSVDCPDYLGEDGEFEVTCESYYSLAESGYTLKGATDGIVKKTFKISELTDVPKFVTKDDAGTAVNFYKDTLDAKVKEVHDDIIGDSFEYLTKVEGDVEEAEFEYSSTYVSYTKETEYDYSTVNRVYWLYKVTFTTDEGNDGAFYYLFYTSDVKVLPDGSFAPTGDDLYISTTPVRNMEAFNEDVVDYYADEFTTEKAS
ncbi:MAG: zinc ribbon domain-containing protein [Ruminococcus sp.]|nr:zinc ribbon domain-containing protein [Ruminococcus sp.]